MSNIARGDAPRNGSLSPIDASPDDVTWLVGDCRETLRTLPDRSVHCAVPGEVLWTRWNDPKTIARFWSKVQRYSGCWLWTKAVDKDGYGKFQITLQRGAGPKQQHVRAHRYSFMIAFGPIPSETLVLHKCDTPRCVRPDHLRAGTQVENHADMIAKGRSAIGDKNGRRRYPDRYPRGDDHHARRRPECLARGERHPHALLESSLVLCIRASYAAGGVTYNDLSMRFGVHASTIGAIVRRKTWDHVAAVGEGSTGSVGEATTASATDGR